VFVEVYLPGGSLSNANDEGRAEVYCPHLTGCDDEEISSNDAVATDEIAEPVPSGARNLTASSASTEDAPRNDTVWVMGVLLTEFIC